MQSENFTVLNVKCGGCVSAVEKGLLELDGVDNVEVVIDGGQVTVKGTTLSRDAISAKLQDLGYPEA